MCALERDFELEWVCECSRVVEHRDVGERDVRHGRCLSVATTAADVCVQERVCLGRVAGSAYSARVDACVWQASSAQVERAREEQRAVVEQLSLRTCASCSSWVEQKKRETRV